MVNRSFIVLIAITLLLVMFTLLQVRFSLDFGLHFARKDATGPVRSVDDTSNRSNSVTEQPEILTIEITEGRPQSAEPPTTGR